VRSSPDGERIALLMKDDGGAVQIFTVSSRGGAITPVTHNQWPIASAFTWSPDGRFIAHAMDGSVCVTDVSSGETRRVTVKDDAHPPRPEACVFSPDGSKIAYVKTIDGINQVFVADAREK
jgi:Tol biopolymer transport system component